MYVTTRTDDARKQESTKLVASSYILRESSDTNKRFSPHIHVLCGKCQREARSHFEQKPGDICSIECKACRQQLELPAREVPVDDVTRKLKDFLLLLQQKVTLCDECWEKHRHERLAVEFCERCTSVRNFCLLCSSGHRHKTLHFLSHDVDSAKLFANHTHSGRGKLEICCAYCQSTGCLHCFVEFYAHSSEGNKLLQQAITDDYQALKEAKENAKESLSTFKREREAIERAEKMAKKEIKQIAETLKQRIDEDRNQLEKEYTSKSEDRICQLRSEMDEDAINYPLPFNPANLFGSSLIDAFYKCGEVRKVTDKLKNFGNTTEKPQPFTLTFKLSEICERQSENIIGKIIEGPVSEAHSGNDLDDHRPRTRDAGRNATGSKEPERSMSPARSLSSSEAGRNADAVETFQAMTTGEEFEAISDPVKNYLKMIDQLKTRIIVRTQRKDAKTQFLNIEEIENLAAAFNSLASHKTEKDRLGDRIFADIKKLHQGVLTACRGSTLYDRSSTLHEQVIEKLDQLEKLLQQRRDQQKEEDSALGEHSGDGREVGPRKNDAEKSATGSVTQETSLARDPLNKERRQDTESAATSQHLPPSAVSKPTGDQSKNSSNVIGLLTTALHLIVERDSSKHSKTPLLDSEETEELKTVFDTLRLHRIGLLHDKDHLTDKTKFRDEEMMDCTESLSTHKDSSSVYLQIIETLNRLTEKLRRNHDQPKPIVEAETLDVSRPGITPLANIGNTCYVNVLIQILCNTDVFLELLRQRFPADDSSRRPTTGLTREFVTLCDGMSKHRALDNPKTSVHSSVIYIPAVFVAALNKQLQKFEIGRQHDSHELFILLLNKIRQEEIENSTKERVGRDSNPPVVDRVFTGRTLTVYVCRSCMTPYHLCEPFLSLSLPLVGDVPVEVDFPSQVIGQLLTGDEYSRAISETLIPIRELSKEETSPVRYRPRLTDSMRYYTRYESMHNEYLCAKCQSNDAHGSHQQRDKPRLTSAVKRTLIFDPPPVLVIHLKRFQQSLGAGYFTKIDKHVDFDFFIDLAPYTSSGAINVYGENGNIWYELYGVVVHTGSLMSGHYYAFVKVRDSSSDVIRKVFSRKCRDRNFKFDEHAITKRMKNLQSQCRSFGKEIEPSSSPGVWYRVSDSNCEKVRNGSEIRNQDAFMLFYDRVDYRATES